IVYLLVLGAGTIAGMSMITMAIAVPFASFGERSARRHAFVRLATGVASVALGLVLAYRIAVVDRLFAAAPMWTPNCGPQRQVRLCVNRERSSSERPSAEEIDASVAEGELSVS